MMQDRKIKIKRQGTNFNRESCIVNRESCSMNRGFTLIEVIIMIVVAGVFASAIFIPFLTSLRGGMAPERVITASYLAQAKMEEFIKYTYSDNHLDPTPVPPDPYVPVPDFPDYDWRWEITLIDADLDVPLCDVGYKQILVSVMEPDGQEFELVSIVTDF